MLITINVISSLKLNRIRENREKKKYWYRSQICKTYRNRRWQHQNEGDADDKLHTGYGIVVGENDNGTDWQRIIYKRLQKIRQTTQSTKTSQIIGDSTISNTQSTTFAKQRPVHKPEDNIKQSRRYAPYCTQLLRRNSREY